MPVMMDKSTVIQMMQSDFVQICRERSNLSKQMKDSEEDVREYMKDLLAQVKSGSLIVVAKTPNVSNMRNISSSIQMIPENEEIELLSLSSACNNTELILEVSNACSGRAKRGASIKATDKIKMQQSIHINDKLRRPSKEDDELLTRKEQNTNTRQVNESVGVNNADISLAAINKDVTGTPIENTNCEKKQSSVNYATVLIEPLPSFKKSANQTFMITNTVLKELSMLNNTSRNRSETRVSQDDGASAGLKNSRGSSKSIIVLEQKKHLSQVNHRNTDNALPEGRQSSLQRRNATSNNSFLVSDVDEVQGTPPKQKGLKSICEVKSGYKPKVLFNPYAPNSVKKRVQAFEEVAVSPKKVETGCVAKNTRKNTRALAETFESPTEVQSISEKCEKKRQLKANPYCKRRLLLGQILTSKNHLLTPSKAQTVINILLNRSCVDNVTRVDAPIQATKSSSKSVNKVSEEKKRHAHNEDARQKREALLKLDAEEKKRKREEKELRNKLSREAQEKLELEKRLKAKREKEEKAKLAQQMQDKQKVLMERRRLLQVQRAQEKEEKRRQEELIRLQRLQDQEEQERLLAELKRQEQELEKRKQALKMKNKVESKQVKAAAAQKQGTNYHKIDSVPANNTDDRSETLYLTQESVQELTAWQKYISPDIRLKYFGVENRDYHYFKHLNSKRLKRTSSACWEIPLE
ncbi:inner centromere protein-like [Copidosoma floridanum]|uniref:inner centromere protein-like n=1 Tax=Copidosoma floridanum TaxID=29053 RepID=UPI000C6F4D6A|nr:inner centromere protein-like [Copidosoma floridanum]